MGAGAQGSDSQAGFSFFFFFTVKGQSNIESVLFCLSESFLLKKI